MDPEVAWERLMAWADANGSPADVHDLGDADIAGIYHSPRCLCGKPHSIEIAPIGPDVNRIEQVSTLVHEVGHAIHWRIREAKPIPSFGLFMMNMLMPPLIGSDRRDYCESVVVAATFLVCQKLGWTDARYLHVNEEEVLTWTRHVAGREIAGEVADVASRLLAIVNGG